MKRNNKTDARPGEKGARSFRRSFGKVVLSVFAAVIVALFGAAPALADTTGPTISKTVKPLIDANQNVYGGKITLSVTGSASSTTTHTNANVIFVVDTSGSMDEASTYTLQVSTYGAYDERGNDLYYRGLIGYHRVIDSLRPVRDDVYAYDANTGTYSKYTGTRYKKIESGTSRLDAAKQSVKSAAQTILAQENTNISLIEFNNSSQTLVEGSRDIDDFNSKVDNLKADYATNWEDALSSAEKLVDRFKAKDKDAKNYVIFVSDGNPTLRNSSMGFQRDGYWNGYQYDNVYDQNGYYIGTDYYDPTYKLYGNGDEDVTGRHFNAANNVANSLVDKGVTLYNINAFGEAANMQKLGWPSSKYFEANNPEALKTSLGEIVQDIVNAHSYRNVVMTDTITNAVAATTADGKLDESSVSVKVTNKDGRDVTPNKNAAGKYTYMANSKPKTFNAPTVVNGKTVTWYLGDDYVLEDGWTYTASFDVLFTQDTLNNAAKLLNGTSASDSNLYVDTKDGSVKAYTNTESGNNVSYDEETTVDNHTTSTPGTKDFDPQSLTVPVASNLTVSKKVSGNAANTTENYNFVLSNTALAGKTYGSGDDAVTFDSNGQYTFQLSHGHSKSVAGIPVGTEVSVKETDLSGNAKTSTTAKVNGVAAATPVKDEGDNATETKPVSVKVTAQAYTLKDGKLVAPTNANTVEFTNTSTLVPQTGIKIDPLPMVVLLGVAVAGGVAVAAGVRKNHGREE